jgi:DNA-binding NtrC family response regulator
VLPIRIPPLRERSADVPMLAQGFLDRSARTAGWSFSEERAATAQGYSWPGNIRELQNMVEYCATMSDGRAVLGTPATCRNASGPMSPLPMMAEAASTSGFWNLRRNPAGRDLNSAQVHERACHAPRMDRSHLSAKLRRHGIRQ